MLTDGDRAFLVAARIGHLATADKTGRPHLVPVCYAVVGEAAYIALDQKPKQSGDLFRLKRVRNIVENPAVCLTVDIYDEDWSKLAFLMLRGNAQLIEGGAEHDAAVLALLARYPQYRAHRLEERPLIAIHVRRVTRWAARDAADKR